MIWLTSLAVVAMWVAGGGVQAAIALAGETVTTFGRLTGPVSANVLLYQVLLMARVPLFERASVEMTSPRCTGSSASGRSRCWSLTWC